MFLSIGIEFASSSSRTEEGGLKMSVMMKELASVNLFIIWLVIIGGFAFLRIVRRRLED